MATRAIKRKALFMGITSLAVSCNDIYSNAENLSPQWFQGASLTNYNPIPQSTPENARFIPDHLCPRCQRWTEGRPWGGSSKLYGYQCACGHQWVDTSPGVKAARERVRKQRGGR